MESNSWKEKGLKNNNNAFISVTKLYSMQNKSLAELNKEWDIAVGKSSIYTSAYNYMK